MSQRFSFNLFKLCLALALATSCVFASGTPVQAAAQSLSAPYSQDFNSLPSAGSSAWTNDTTLPGWYASRAIILADDGTSGGGGMYSYGTAGSTERAFGALPKKNTGSTVYKGVLLQNDTGVTLDELFIAYTGEQWRNSGGGAQVVEFSYQVSATAITDLTAGNWTNVAGLNFDAVVTGGIAGPLNGNLPANQRRISASVPVSIPAGSYIMLRWIDADDKGADHGLAVDDLLVSRNMPPQAIADSYSTAEDTPLTVAAPGVLANDTDLEGSPLTAALVMPAAHGTMALNADGSFTYTPEANWHGTDSFTYTASDGNFSSEAATVTLTVTAVNDAPTAVSEVDSVAEDQTLIVAVPGVLGNDSDIDGDPLSAELESGPTNGSLTLNADGGYTYTPAADWNGSDSFAYRAYDGELYSNAVTVTLTVSPVNDAPAGTADAYATEEDTALQVAAPGVLVNDTDIDGDPFSAAVAASPAHGALALNPDGSFSYTPDADWNGVDGFTYYVSDGQVLSAPVAVSLTVNLVNDAPVAGFDSGATNEDVLLTVVAPGVLGNDSDIDLDALSAVLVLGPDHGSLTLNADGSYTYTPAADWNGDDRFTYTAYDGTAYSNTATVTLTVQPVADAPVGAADSYAAVEDELLTVAAPGLLANDTDADGDALSVVWVSDPPHGTLTLNADGSFTYLPEANWNGNDSFTYQASDGGLDSAPVEVTLAVAPINDAPAAVEDAYTGSEDLVMTMLPAGGVLANDTDIDGDSLSAVLVSQPAHGTLSWYGYNGTFMYTPDADWNGSDSFTYVASDGTLTSNTVTVTLIIQPVNDAPAATADAYSLDEDGVLAITAGSVLANDADVDGDALTAVLDAAPLHGDLTLNADGSFNYAPQADWNGADSFSYHAFDGQAASGVVAVTLTVSPVNDAPVLLQALPDQDAPARVLYSFAAAAHFDDIDAVDVLTFAAESGDGSALPGWLSIDPASGVLSGTPDNAQAGSYTLKITASDGLAAVSGEFTLTVKINLFRMFLPAVTR